MIFEIDIIKSFILLFFGQFNKINFMFWKNLINFILYNCDKYKEKNNKNNSNFKM